MSQSSESRRLTDRRNRLFALLATIISVAVMLSAVSYGYFLSVSERIKETVKDELRREARVEAFHLGKLVENTVAVVAGHTLTAANSPLILGGDVDNGGVAINNRQNITSELTDRYLWLDEQGRTVWSSAFVNRTELELFQGFDVSDRPYFANPAETGRPFISSVIQSPIDKSQRIFLSYPIFSGTGIRIDPESIRGVIVASIKADALGELVRNQLSEELESSVGIIDPNGVVVFSSNSTLVGENIFEDKIQSILSGAFASPDELSEFNDFMMQSLDGSSDSRDFSTADGASSTVTYLPILVNIDASIGGNQSASQHFLTLYITTPHNIAGKVAPLVEQVRNFSLAVIIAVSAVTVVIAYVVLLWNRRLEQTVRERTASLNAANEQLKLHDKMQTEFINIAAHELRTPVQPIKGVVEMARLMSRQQHGGAVGIDGKVVLEREEAEMLYRNATRLEKLTEDILDVTRIESQMLRLKKERLDLVEMIGTIVQDIQHHKWNNMIGDKKDIRIVYEKPDTPIMIEADRTRIFEVLSNLLGNALKFTDSGSITVKSTVVEQGDGVLVLIRDTGRGIDQSIMPRLFTKFATNSESGTGLGLYISKSIIEAHGGTMWAENNRDGAGATFFFTLPLSTGKQQQQHDSKAAGAK